MTTEIEKQFFNTFGIEPDMCIHAKYGYESPEGTWYFCNKNRDRCWTYPSSSTTCKYRETSYPEITDRILLELICILSEWRTYLDSSYTIKANNTLHLKQDILKDFLELFKWYEFKKCEKGIKQQVRTLFEED